MVLIQNVVDLFDMVSVFPVTIQLPQHLTGTQAPMNFLAKLISFIMRIFVIKIENV